MVPQKSHSAPPDGWAVHTYHGLCRRCRAAARYAAGERKVSGGRGTPGRGGDVDTVAVDRAVSGHPPARLTSGEIDAAVAILTRRGLSAPAIARRIGVAERTVVRHRSRP